MPNDYCLVPFINFGTLVLFTRHTFFFISLLEIKKYLPLQARKKAIVN
jgi:hypothetical protein